MAPPTSPEARARRLLLEESTRSETAEKEIKEQEAEWEELSKMLALKGL